VTNWPATFSPFWQFVHHDKSVPFTRTFKKFLYRDNFCNRDSFKIAQQLTRTVGVINLSQFLRATLTVLSWHWTLHSSIKSVTSALDKSCIQDNFIFRRDLQKLRHGGLPAGTVFWLKYRDSYRRTAPPTFTPSTAGPLVLTKNPCHLDSYLRKLLKYHWTS